MSVQPRESRRWIIPDRNLTDLYCFLSAAACSSYLQAYKFPRQCADVSAHFRSRARAHTHGRCGALNNWFAFRIWFEGVERLRNNSRLPGRAYPILVCVHSRAAADLLVLLESFWWRRRVDKVSISKICNIDYVYLILYIHCQTTNINRRSFCKIIWFILYIIINTNINISFVMLQIRQSTNYSLIFVWLTNLIIIITIE